MCDIGFVDVGEGKLLCVPITTCEADTCGCRFNPGSHICVPLGRCYIEKGTGRAMCNCSAAYVGTWCSACAPGFYDYPDCTRCRNGGVWNAAMASCECPKNYAGSACEKCASGYKNYPACTKGANVAGIVAGVVLGAAAVALIAIVAFLFMRKKGVFAPRDFKGRYSMIAAMDGEIDDEGAPEVVVGDALPPPGAESEMREGTAPQAAAPAAAAPQEAPAAPEAAVPQPARLDSLDDFDPRALPLPAPEPTEGAAVLSHPSGDFVDSSSKGLLS